mmetsp:Transcript_22504/g.64758  ORF Transcript_22504/g.64758 Transcript_22504/m.64758 type:complete len:247 (+) Transcript_22504:603-1343(+)
MRHRPTGRCAGASAVSLWSARRTTASWTMAGLRPRARTSRARLPSASPAGAPTWASSVRPRRPSCPRSQRCFRAARLARCPSRMSGSRACGRTPRPSCRAPCPELPLASASTGPRNLWSTGQASAPRWWRLSMWPRMALRSWLWTRWSATPPRGMMAPATTTGAALGMPQESSRPTVRLATRKATALGTGPTPVTVGRVSTTGGTPHPRGTPDMAAWSARSSTTQAKGVSTLPPGRRPSCLVTMPR